MKLMSVCENVLIPEGRIDHFYKYEASDGEMYWMVQTANHEKFMVKNEALLKELEALNDAEA